MMNKKLKFGIDFHGVIDSNYSFFKEFTKEAYERGYELFIITGGGKEDVALLLDINEIKYDYLYSLKDYFQAQGILKIFEDGHFWVPEEMWNDQKAKFCFENQIDIHIDDSSEYLKQFKTTFCLYDKTKTECVFQNNIKINFQENPCAVLEKIEKYIYSIQ